MFDTYSGCFLYVQLCNTYIKIGLLKTIILYFLVMKLNFAVVISLNHEFSMSHFEHSIIQIHSALSKVGFLGRYQKHPSPTVSLLSD